MALLYKLLIADEKVSFGTLSILWHSGLLNTIHAFTILSKVVFRVGTTIEEAGGWVRLGPLAFLQCELACGRD